MAAPKNKKMPTAVNPGVVGRIASKGWCDSLNISPSSNSFIGLLAPGTSALYGFFMRQVVQCQ